MMLIYINNVARYTLVLITNKTNIIADTSTIIIGILVVYK